MPSTKSKNIIITGGARGIGRCTARHLLSLPVSHRVFIIDFDADELEYTVNTHLAAYAPRVSSSITNLRNPEEIRSAVDKAAEFFGGRIDVLVNNAGVARGFFNAGNGTMEDIATGEQWEAYIATNLSAPFYMSQAFILRFTASSSCGATSLYDPFCISLICKSRALHSCFTLTQPGEIARTRIPQRWHETDMACVSASTPPLLAA